MNGFSLDRLACRLVSSFSPSNDATLPHIHLNKYTEFLASPSSSPMTPDSRARAIHLFSSDLLWPLQSYRHPRAPGDEQPPLCHQCRGPLRVRFRSVQYKPPHRHTRIPNCPASEKRSETTSTTTRNSSTSMPSSTGRCSPCSPSGKSST